VHEVISGIIVWECFKDELPKLCANRKCDADFEFVIRCITGVCYTKDDTPDIYYRNALICLLNSNAIDVDKLDYIKRDSIISGYDSISVDTHRLLNSLTTVTVKKRDGKTTSTLAFGKSALSVIQNVVDYRNMLYTWGFTGIIRWCMKMSISSDKRLFRFFRKIKIYEKT